MNPGALVSGQSVRWASLAAGLLGLAALGTALLAGALTGAPAPTLVRLPSASAGASGMVVRDAHADRLHGYIAVVGEATNGGMRTQQHVEAVAEFFDGAGRLVKAESALVMLGAVRPGDESPFRILTPDDPAVASFRVRLQRLLGGPL